jgi:hypothetical protein
MSVKRDGKLSYIQIPAVDARESATFYEKVFVWRINPGGGRDHTGFQDGTGELIGAWVTGREIADSPGVLPYIYVDHIDDVLERIAANGGETVREPYREGEGDLWVATFRDPAGNVLGLWHSGPR